MAGKLNTHVDRVLNILRGQNVTAPANVFVGLLSANPATDADSGTEISAGGYARQQVTFSAPETDSGNVRRVRNSNLITFGPATENWPEAVGFGVYTASTAGEMLYWGPLDVPKTVLNGDKAEFAVNALVVKED
jgi:hypothetical protein